MIDQQPDQQADPIKDVLDAVPTSNRVRAAAWQAFNDAKDKDDLVLRLKDITLPEQVKAALWEAKPEMNFASVKDLSQLTKDEGPVERFAAGAVRANPVTNAVDMISQMVTSPTAAGKAIVEPSVERIERAKTAYGEGRPLDALGNVAAATPMIGPYVGGAVDRMREGDVAGGLGELSWLGAPALKKGAAVGRGAVQAGRALVPGTMDAIANTLDRSANESAAKFMSPQIGPNKTRLGNQAVKVAPKLLRDPELGALSREGFATKVKSRFQQAGTMIDDASDARHAGQQVQTGPILRQLDAEIGKLTASPVDASKAKPKVGDWKLSPDGFSRDVKAQPMGKAVEPAPNASQIGTLRQIRSEVAQLGEVAPYEGVRRIRASWDKVARMKYLAATAADALKSAGDVDGAAAGTAAMREALAKTDPQSATAYAQYHVYKAAHDVVQAAEEADRVRPNRGRSIMARTLGGMIGAEKAGTPGAMIGALTAGIVDKLAEKAPSFQLSIARRLAGVADALRGGEVERAQVMTDRIVRQFPAAKTGLRLVGKGAANLGRSVNIPASLAADEQDPSDTKPVARR